mgnify:CR=1 FL=1
MNLLNISQFSHIDLRSEGEFEKSTIPNSVNLPILNDHEFQAVGKKYKNNGQEAALKLGLELVTGDLKKQRLRNWESHINLNNGCSIFCFRGGLRSKLAQEWLLEKKISIDRISGGYKKVRNEILEQFSNDQFYKKEWFILGGLTGSGKTILLNKFQQSVDIEGIANHRGSAFGRTSSIQTSCANFENKLMFNYINNKSSNILLEDESRTIGKATLPNFWYNKMQSSNLIVLDINIEDRITNIIDEYITLALKENEDSDLLMNKYLNALEKIQKRLGGELYKKINDLIKNAFKNNSTEKHRLWIYELLENYYDPMYQHKLKIRDEDIIHRGGFDSCFDYINSL